MYARLRVIFRVNESETGKVTSLVSQILSQVHRPLLLVLEACKANQVLSRQ